MAERPKFDTPVTVAMPLGMKTDLQRIADNEILSLSDVLRRAAREEILRADRKADDDDR